MSTAVEMQGMSEESRFASRQGSRAQTPAEQNVVNLAIVALASDSPSVRRNSRQLLVVAGRHAVRSLIEALSDPREVVRRETAGALGEIGDLAAAHPLIRALEDDRPGVRVDAAAALTALGPGALAPLLRALMERPTRDRLRAGAHRVLAGLRVTASAVEVAPVLAALAEERPSATLASVAREVLRALASYGRHGAFGLAGSPARAPGS
jgi:HEAT repeat protein